MSVSFREYANNRGKKTLYLDKCPICESGWTVVGGSGCEPVITEFVHSLNKVMKMLTERDATFPAGFALTIEVKEEPKNERQNN